MIRRHLPLCGLLLFGGCEDDEGAPECGQDSSNPDGCGTTGTGGSTDGDTATGGQGEVDCAECNSSPLCHNNAQGDMCVCDSGYTWADPNDSADLTCVSIERKPGDAGCTNEHNVLMGDLCMCEEGFSWCTAEPGDLTCCEDPAQGMTG